MMAKWVSCSGPALGILLGLTLSALAQAAGDTALPTLGAAPAPAAAAPPPGWTSLCQAASRSAPLDCHIEQRAVLAQTGQLVASVSVRVPADPRNPVLMVRVPLGLSLDAGVTLDVDGVAPRSLPLQTCDGSGCYAGAPLPAEFLAAMRAGQKLGVVFQNLSKEPIKLSMSLIGFSDAYDKVK